MRLTTIATLPLLFTSVSAFITPSCNGIQRTTFVKIQTATGSSSLNMSGGFGGGGGKKDKKKAPSPLKLKPKSQWDKFKTMKKESSVKVAVRISANNKSDGTDAGEWFDIGRVKSKGDEFTALAVVVQRAIIVEHAKRLHPLQFLPKDQVEWAYDSNDEWVVVDKNLVNPAPSNIEKMVGFEGNPDLTGFYSTSTGKQFVAEGTASPLANGSAMLDRSVLPRVK